MPKWLVSFEGHYPVESGIKELMGSYSFEALQFDEKRESGRTIVTGGRGIIFASPAHVGSIGDQISYLNNMTAGKFGFLQIK